MVEAATTESAVLEVADALLAAEGSNALSLRRIADAAGTSTQSVYTSFGGKPGLADALYRRGYALLAAELEQLPMVADTWTRLLDLGRTYRRVALDNAHHYELMTGRPIPEYRPPRDSRRFAASTMRPLLDAVATAIDEGLFEGEPLAVAQRFWATVHGQVSLEINGLLEVDDAAFDELLVRLGAGHRPA